MKKPVESLDDSVGDKLDKKSYDLLDVIFDGESEKLGNEAQNHPLISIMTFEGKLQKNIKVAKEVPDVQVV